MNWPYAYTPQIWPAVGTVLLSIVLAVFSGRRRNVPGALPFLIGCLFAAVWTVGSVMELAAVDVATKVFWIKFQAGFQLPCATAITCFFLEYAWPGRWLSRRNLALLSMPFWLALALILTNDLHHLMWRGFDFDGSITPVLAPLSWFFVVYGYALGVVNFVVLAWLFARSPQHRLPVVILLTGLVATRVVYMLEKVNILQLDLPVDVLGIAFSYLMYVVALFGFKILDPIPLARQQVITQMSEGVFVLDNQGQMTSLNPAAERILRATSRQVKGKSIIELLPAFPGEHLEDPGETEIEFSLGLKGEIRHYATVISPLRDFRGLAVGRLLLLHDVTVQKRAQAQIVEQQRALAMLHEREQLARELHDSIGQTLGFASFQLEAATKLVQDDQAASAVTQLKRLAGIIRDAHADVREYILDLHSTLAPQQLFFATLRRYLKGYTQNYGIQASLSADKRLGDEPFSPDDRMHVYRIIQEALSNARKHGQARSVQVSFTLENRSIRMTIQDDGAGFDPSQAAREGHFGLKFMRERVEELGGRLEVESAVGEGTRVLVEIPLDRKR